MISSGMRMKAMKNGADSASVSAMVRFWARNAPSGLPLAKKRLISGSSTVPAAMPMTPIGSW